MSTQDPTGERLTTVIEVDRCSLPSLAPYPHHTSPLLQLLALASAVVHQTTAAPPPPLWPADNTGNEHFAAMLLLRSRTSLLPFPFSSQAKLWKTTWWSSWTLDRAGLLVLSLRLVWYPGAPIQPQKPLFQQDGRWNEDDFHFLCIHLATLKKNRRKKICHYSNPKQELRNGELHSVGK